VEEAEKMKSAEVSKVVAEFTQGIVSEIFCYS